MPKGDGSGVTNVATTGHNAKARAAQIKKAFKDMERLDGQIADLRADQTKIKDAIKNDLGMKKGDFMAAYRMAQMDADNRDALLDTCRECFDAMGLGDQLDFEQVARRIEEREAAPETEDADATA